MVDIASKKQRLIRKSITVLVKEPRASLGEIAKGIGVGRATLQRYFPKRDDLLREIALETILKTDEVLAPLYHMDLSAEEILLKMFEALIPLGDYYHFLASSPEVMAFEDVIQECERQMKELRLYVQDLKQEGLIAPDVPVAWAVHMIDMLIWTAWSAIEDGSIARNDAAQLAVRTLMTGLSTPLAFTATRS
ncbi:MAG: TetR/AcrR family transcriptional regulator [Chloroflexota bacterium]